MSGFDVRKLPPMVMGADKRRGLLMMPSPTSPDFFDTTPRQSGIFSGATPTPTMFSDLVDILHNGQRQGVMVFRSGSGLQAAISSPRPPPSFTSIPIRPSASTSRAFFSAPSSSPSSPFPFDRRVNMQPFFQNSPQATPPSTSFSSHSFSNPPLPPSPTFSSHRPLTFPNNNIVNNNNNNNFVNNNNNNNIDQLVDASGFDSGQAPLPERLIIHVVEQQKLGQLKTSNGPVQQQQQVFRPKRPKKKKKDKKSNKKSAELAAANAEDLVNELKRQGKDSLGPSLTFLTSSSKQRINSNFDFRTGRQVNTDKVVVPGFPNGLPSGTPEGVKLALASAVRGKVA
jgi:hypothetical protein